MKDMKFMKKIVVVTVAAATLGIGSLASATVVGGTSDAYNAYVGVSALGLSVGIGPLTQASGTAPNTYDRNAGVDVSALAVTGVGSGVLSAGLAAGLNTGLLKSHAASDVDRASGDRSARADQYINQLNIGLHDHVSVLGIGLLDNPILGLHADTITSNALVSGDVGAWDHAGSSLIEGLNIRVLGLDIAELLHINLASDIYVNALPNTRLILNVLGLVDVALTLNEQIWTEITDADGTQRRALEVNAIDLKLNGLGGALLDTDIIIGHSFAALEGEATPVPPAAVPEPSTFALIGSGLAGLFFWRRRSVKA